MRLKLLILFSTIAALLTTAPYFPPSLNSPSAVFLIFRHNMLAGNIDASWELLSSSTKFSITHEVKSMVAELESIRAKTEDPALHKVLDDIFTATHLNSIKEDRDCWAAMLTEAFEHGDKPVYLSPALKVMGERRFGDTAMVDIVSGSASGVVNMVLEDGQWKVEQPYVIKLAEAGWNVDYAVGLLALIPFVLPDLSKSLTKPKNQRPVLSFPIIKQRQSCPIRIDGV